MFDITEKQIKLKFKYPIKVIVNFVIQEILHAKRLSISFDMYET